MPHSPRLVANAFIFKAKKQGVPITHLRLQKLVFFTHAWSLALHGKTWIDDQPQAWPFGPVFESLFHDLKTNGTGPVSSFLTELNPATGKLEAFMPLASEHATWNLIDEIWDRYAKFSDEQVSFLCSEDGGSWSQARSHQFKFIHDHMIRSEYLQKLDAAKPTKAIAAP